MTDTAVRPWHARFGPLPFDFAGTTTYIGWMRVTKKVDNSAIAITRGAPMGISQSIAVPNHFIFVASPFGEIEIRVSKGVFDLMNEGDRIIVRYWRGRFTRSLKGNIAQ